MDLMTPVTTTTAHRSVLPLTPHHTFVNVIAVTY